MSLLDTDPNTTNRLDPKPQAPDQDPVRQSDGTTAITNKLDSSDGSYVSTKDGAVKVNNGTNMLGLFGPDSTGEMVIKIAKPGYDATTATDEQLVFNSSQNVFKIVGEYTTTLSALTSTNGGGGGSAQTSATSVYAHGLGFRPIVIAHYIPDAEVNYVALPFSETYTVGSTGIAAHGFVAVINATDVTIRRTLTIYSTTALASVSVVAATVKVYLLQETAN